MTDEPKEPREFKTYSDEPIRMFIYLRNKEGTPISYTRIYHDSLKQIMQIDDAVKDFYGYIGPGRDNKKMTVQDIHNATGMPKDSIRRNILKMATVRMVYKRVNKRWEIERDKPFIIIQQKWKHIQKEYWGTRTPVYVLPYDAKYIQPQTRQSVYNLKD